MILSGLGLRRRGVEVIACPTCARAEFDVVKTAETIERRLSGLKQPLRVAVMGCIVNGPGEARLSDIGVVGTKKGAQIYVNGKKLKLIPKQDILSTLVKLTKELSSNYSKS